MTKKILTKALAVVVVLSTMLSLTACGKPSEEQEAPAEYIYSPEFKPISGEATSSLNVKVYTENGAYASCDEKIGREIPETADVENMTEDDLTRFDIYATNIYFIDSDGNASKLPDYEPLKGNENTDGHADFYSQPGLNTIALDSSGNLMTVEYLYTGWYDGPEGKTYADEDYYDYYKSYQEVFLRTLDPSGKELKRVSLELEPEQYFRSSSVTDDEGNLLGAVETELRAFNSEGQAVYSIDCHGYVESVLKLGDGRIYLTIWGDNGLSLVPLDSAARALGKSLKVPDDAYSPIAGGSDYDLYYTSGLNFYGYDIETETAEKLFNWINCDVNSEDISLLKIDENGVVSGVVSEFDIVSNTYTNSRLTVSQIPYDPSTAKTVLTLSCLSLSSNTRDAVIKFNRSSDSARIEIKDYSEFNTGDDSEAGSQKLLTEIMAGNVSDLIALDGLPYKRIASKGILEDLYPYLDSDKDLQRDDIFQNILGVLETDGKLCSVCPSFYVATVMGAVSVVGDKQSWTYDDFDAALATMPEGCEPFEPGVSRYDILRACLSLDMAGYVDWSTGKCSFDSENFTKLLAFANRFPQDHTDESDETTQERISTGKQMLIATSIYSLDDALYDSSYFGGKDICYIGFPTMSGSGNVLTAESCFAMTTACRDKDAAWQFLRIFLTEKYQENSVWSIPTNMNAYNAKLAQMMKTNYLMDDNGQYVLDENGEKVKEPRYTMSSDDGPVVNVYAMTKEQADEITAVINSSTKFYDYDQSIISIVCEEAEAYFAGQKSAEEVAKLVQGKANIYVNEQK